MATLLPLLKRDAVPFPQLHERYGALLELVRKLIGVVPNCDPYLEIWPPGFRAYNVMVPNLLNLPFSLWGLGAPADVVGLAMYAASRAAGCMYCAAHSCSFALRRGAAPSKVAGALDTEEGVLSPGERAAVAMARALAVVPSALGDAERQELARHYAPADAEWIVLGVVMMGFLNKFMDAVGVELEVPTAAEVNGVIGKTGWSAGKHLDGAPTDGAVPRADTLGTKLSVVSYLPAALSLDRRWTAGVPGRWPEVGEHLRARTGHDFPVLSRLRHRRAIRAIAAMVRENLDAATTVLGLGAKREAGLVFAAVVGNPVLATELRALSVPEAAAPPSVLRLARAMAPSPAQISEEDVAACRELPAAAVVELAVWVATLQMLHRLSIYYSG